MIRQPGTAADSAVRSLENGSSSVPGSTYLLNGTDQCLAMGIEARGYFLNEW